MKELDQILDSWRARGQGVLATVVQVRGSAYRRPGARMLIMPNGLRIGSVSGGCLEGDLSRKAWWLTEEGRPVLRTYDTNSDEDAVWEFGLGCNGVIDVLLERLNTPDSSGMMEFLESVRQGRGAARIATVIRGPQVGARLWIGTGGDTAGPLRGSEPACGIEPLLRNASKNQVVLIGSSEVFLEIVEPAQPLLIFGTGHDVKPLVNIASELGWRAVTATDPHMEEIPAQAAVVLMTHNYAQDLALLPNLLSRPLRYLGILGPRTRTDRLFQDLGIAIPENVHAPIGLDIGAGTPEMIALAIVSEIAAVLAGRQGAMLRDRDGPIYDHPVTQFVPQLAACELA